MLDSGEDPLYVVRRLVRFASEDIGNADPRALTLALAAKDAYDFLGSPEGELASRRPRCSWRWRPSPTPPTSRSTRRKADVQERPAEPVPLHIRNAPTGLMKDLGYGSGYQYAHDAPDARVDAGALAGVAARSPVLPAHRPRSGGRAGAPSGRLEALAGGAQTTPLTLALIGITPCQIPTGRWSMKRVLLVAILALAILGLSTGTTLAAPGEPRVVQGTLEWPAAVVSTQPFVVIRGDDGRMYYADIDSAQRRTPGPLAAGSRVAVLGIEGSRPYEIAAIAIGAGDAASLGLVPGASSEPSAAVSSGSVVPAEDMWRVDGTVETVNGSTVGLRGPDGRTRSVDLSQLSESTWRTLRPGERISVFGAPRDDRRLIANGFIQGEGPPPAASPRLGR